MAVFRETQIEWAGQAYTFTPSNRLLRTIEREVPIIGYMARSSREHLAADTAFILAAFIREGGGKVSEDELYSGLMDDIMNNKGAGYFALVGCIAEIILPESVAKNFQPPEKAAGGRAQATET